MKKIPGTMYEIEIATESDGSCFLGLYYRKEKILEKSRLSQEALPEIIEAELKKAGLEYPRNRIKTLIQDNLRSVKPAETSFIEGAMSQIMDDVQKKGGDKFNKIILLGLGNAGKTSIYERIFERKRPWELLHSVATKGITYRNYDMGPSFKPVIWDLGGQADYRKSYHDQLSDQIFTKANLLLYIIDVSDPNKFLESAQELEWAGKLLLKSNPNGKIFVLLHKIDIVYDKQAVIKAFKEETLGHLPFSIRLFPTSIFDESLFWAWSEIVRGVYPKSQFIQALLKQAKGRDFIQDILLVEKTTGLTVASTLEESEEDVLIGMTSLLIITLERLLRELKSTKFIELKLHAQGLGLLLADIPNCNMVMVLKVTESIFENEYEEKYRELKQLVQQLAIQIRNLWEKED